MMITAVVAYLLTSTLLSARGSHGDCESSCNNRYLLLLSLNVTCTSNSEANVHVDIHDRDAVDTFSVVAHYYNKSTNTKISYNNVVKHRSTGQSSYVFTYVYETSLMENTYYLFKGCGEDEEFENFCIDHSVRCEYKSLSSSRSVYLSTSPIFEYPHSMTTSSSDFIIATSTSMFTTDSSQFTTSSIHSHILSTTDSSKFITSSSETLETPTTVLITVRAGSVDSDIANIIIILIASICAGLLIGVITALFFCLAFCQRRISNKTKQVVRINVFSESIPTSFDIASIHSVITIEEPLRCLHINSQNKSTLQETPSSLNSESLNSTSPVPSTLQEISSCANEISSFDNVTLSLSTCTLDVNQTTKQQADNEEISITSTNHDQVPAVLSSNRIAVHLHNAAFAESTDSDYIQTINHEHKQCSDYIRSIDSY